MSIEFVCSCSFLSISFCLSIPLSLSLSHSLSLSSSLSRSLSLSLSLSFFLSISFPTFISPSPIISLSLYLLVHFSLTHLCTCRCHCWNILDHYRSRGHGRWIRYIWSTVCTYINIEINLFKICFCFSQSISLELFLCQLCVTLSLSPRISRHLSFPLSHSFPLPIFPSFSFSPCISLFPSPDSCFSKLID